MPALVNEIGRASRKISDSCGANFPNSTSRSPYLCGVERRRSNTQVAISTLVAYPFIGIFVLFAGHATAGTDRSTSFRLSRNSSVQRRSDIFVKVSSKEADEISFVRNSNLSSCPLALACMIAVCMIACVVTGVHPTLASAITADAQFLRHYYHSVFE